MPAASYALLPNLKKGLFCAIGEGSRFFVVCFLHTSGEMFLNQTPGRRPPRITGRVVNTDQRVGRSPQLRAPFRIHDTVVGFVDRCECRGLEISPLRIKHLAEFFSGRSWHNIWPGFIFFVFFSSLELSLWRFVLRPTIIVPENKTGFVNT